MEVTKHLLDFFFNPEKSWKTKTSAMLFIFFSCILVTDWLGYPKYYFTKQRLETAITMNKMANDTSFSLQTRKELKLQAEYTATYKPLISKVYLGLQDFVVSRSTQRQSNKNITNNSIDNGFWQFQFTLCGIFYIFMAALVCFSSERFYNDSMIKEIALRLLVLLVFSIIGVIMSVLWYCLFSLSPIRTNAIPLVSFFSNLVVVFIFMNWLKRRTGVQ